MECGGHLSLLEHEQISEKMQAEGSALNRICEETGINSISCVAHHVHLKERKLVLKKNQKLLVRLGEISCLMPIGF